MENIENETPEEENIVLENKEEENPNEVEVKDVSENSTEEQSLSEEELDKRKNKTQNRAICDGCLSENSNRAPYSNSLSRDATLWLCLSKSVKTMGYYELTQLTLSIGNIDFKRLQMQNV